MEKQNIRLRDHVYETIGSFFYYFLILWGIIKDFLGRKHTLNGVAVDSPKQLPPPQRDEEGSQVLSLREFNPEGYERARAQSIADEALPTDIFEGLDEDEKEAGPHEL